MRHKFKKVLAVLIAIQLGLSPLQGAIAGFSDSFDQLGDSYQMGDAFDSSMAACFDCALNQNCGQRNVDDNCFDYSCFSGQCTASALMLSKLTPYPPYPTTTTPWFPRRFSRIGPPEPVACPPPLHQTDLPPCDLT